MWLHNGSDLLIGIAYLAIPAVLVYFLKKRRDLPFPHLFLLFGAFIVLCGTTHLADARTSVAPMYRFSGLLKLSTAAISIATVFCLVPLLPRALALRSREALERLNRRLQLEVTERKAAQTALGAQAERLRAANAKLLASERVKDDFLATVSHELRTPLTLILGPLESLLAESCADPLGDRAHSLRTVHNNAVRLMQMVLSLLDFSKLDADQLTVRRQPIALAALTRAIVADFGPALDAKGQTVTVDVRPDPLRVAMDSYLYEHILFNLLGNAIKFTPAEGAIDIRVRHDGTRLTLEVEDTGISIRAEDIDGLFEKFRQVESTPTRRFEGTGLGLALVRQFAKLLGGEVGVRSSPGQGSTFTVTCDAPPTSGAEAASPRRMPVPIPVASSPARARRPSGEALPRVLVAEDNPEMRAYLARVLGDAADVATAADGDEALARVRSWEPDLLLADVMMPKRDGFDLCRTLRADPAHAELPIVLVTALTNRNALMRGWSVGADEYVYKPFHPHELLTRVANLLRLRRLRREARAAVADRDRARARVASDKARLLDSLDAPLRTLLERARRVRDTAGDPEEPVAALLDATRAVAATVTGLSDDPPGPLPERGDER